jgi:hypothetical protein
MSRSVHSVKLTPYHSSQLNGLSYSLGDVVFDQDNLTLRVMDGETFGGQTLATQGYINTVFSQAIITVGNSTNATTSYPSGSFRIAGGASINKDLTVIGNLNATLATQLQPNITSLGTLTGLTSSGAVNITNNTAASSIGTGALQVSGGASIAGNLYVGGSLNITGSNLTIDNVSFNNGLTLSGNTSPSTEFFTITNGALTPVTKFQVDTSSGNTTIAGTLGVTGNTTLGGALAINGILTVNGLPLQTASTFTAIVVNTDCGNLGGISVDAFGVDITAYTSNSDCNFSGPITILDLASAGLLTAAPI